jgi:hypothetical protein
MAFTQTTYSQPSEQEESGVRIPLTIGFGGATHRFATSINVTYPVKYHMFSFEFLYLTEVKVPLGEAPSPPASKDIEYSLLYGVCADGSVGLASVSSGFSLVKSIHVSNEGPNSLTVPLQYTVERVTSVGLPLRVQVILKASRDLGLGLTYFSNFNNHSAYEGALFSFRMVIR